MDFKMKASDIDGTISQFRNGISALQDEARQLSDVISQFEGGGFTGQSANLAFELIRRKLKLVNDLTQTYENAVKQLQQAKKKQEESDQELKSRVNQIC